MRAALVLIIAVVVSSCGALRVSGPSARSTRTRVYGRRDPPQEDAAFQEAGHNVVGKVARPGGGVGLTPGITVKSRGEDDEH
jgi:hypothetical protein